MIPNSNQQVLQEKEAIMEQAMLNALAFAAITGSPKDEISERQAWATYGKRYIIERTELNMLHYTHKGGSANSVKIYSRFEIECQKRAEKHITDVYIRAARAYENETKQRT